MKSSKSLISFILPIFGLLIIIGTLNAQERIHPYNKILMKLYPRPFKMPYPQVPRILAIQALALYRSGKAVFVHVGDEGPDVPGGFHFRESETWRMNLTLFKKLSKIKVIILYCA